jgi:hypothetical protein
MSKTLTRVALLAAFALTAGAVSADDLPPTEEQIEAKLRETRQRLEAAQAEERALQKQLAEAQKTSRGQIRAEVEGVLCWQDEGGGYYIRVRPKGDPSEVRVWLVLVEDRVLLRTLEDLKGKDVVAKGELQQRTGTGWRVPAGGLYLTNFKVSGVTVK